MDNKHIKIGIIKEGKTPPDRRVALIPEDCRALEQAYPNLKFFIQHSDVRKIDDQAYSKMNITTTHNIKDCDIIIGVKEVNLEDLVENKTFMFFSHTIKEQPYNKNLLKTIIEKNIRLIDYEALTDNTGSRIIGFGRHAGIVGCYNAFYAYGKRLENYTLERAFTLNGLSCLYKELEKVKLPNNFKIVLTGSGKVAKGSLEILKQMQIQQVFDAKDFIHKTFQKPVFINLETSDYTKPKLGFEDKHIYTDSECFENAFTKFSKVADMYIAGHLWKVGAPNILSNQDLIDSKLKVIADISCDIKGPISSTIRPSTIESPLYGYNPVSQKECHYKDLNGITIMAVDNLPCELPYEASKDFSNHMKNDIMPELIKEHSEIIDRATVCKNKKLTPYFEYLTHYINS